MSELKTVTPDWLEAKGFMRYQEDVEYEDHYFPGAVFDVEFDSDDLCYVEKHLDRNRFCIVLTPQKCTDDSVWYSFEVWIQDDIGCGWIPLPNKHSEMTQYHFCLLFKAIRAERL